jgi:acid stress chaperone HdeB
LVPRARHVVENAIRPTRGQLRWWNLQKSKGSHFISQQSFHRPCANRQNQDGSFYSTFWILDPDDGKREGSMTKFMFAAAMLLFASAVHSTAHAQVSLDVSKITCEQFSGYKITDPKNIAMWLSGYYNGKRSNTIIDTQGLDANAKKLLDYCIVNSSVPVMQATETLFGSNR